MRAKYFEPCSKYAIPTKPGPCFLQYHIAMSNLFLQQSVTYKEVIIRDPVSHSPMVHSEVISRLLAGITFRNDSLPAIYEQNRRQEQISYLTLPRVNCSHDIRFKIK